MEYFHYKVKDQKGQELEGTISSADQQKATEALQARGFKVLNIVSRSQLSVPKPVLNQPAAKVPMPTMPTYGLYQYKGTDKQRYFILGQMSELLRAGVNPAQGFVTLGQNQGNVGFKKSLEEMAATSTAGGSISEVMRRYPRLYPEHVIGMTMAGEQGGFLPEALNVAAEQAKNTHSFKVFHWFVWAVIINLFTSVPISMLTTMAFRDTFFKTMDAGGGTSKGVMADYIAIFGKLMAWPVGPITLTIFGTLFIAWLWYMKPQNTLMRHKAALKHRITKKRAYLECASIFTWAISRLSRSGITPDSSWRLAARCVPNYGLRERLEEAGSMMSEGSRLSEALQRSSFLPPEYASFAATGEMTGTIPGTFERLSNAAHDDFQGQTNRAKYQSGCLGCVWFMITYFLGTVAFFYFYGQILESLLKEING